MMKPKYKLAIPKKGRIAEKTEALLKKSGFLFTRKYRQDVAYCKNFPLMVVYLPSHDIPLYVGEGEVHFGITGQDLIAENDVQIREIETLGYGKCRLCVQAPKGKFTDIEQLKNKRIITSFPKLTEQYFSQKNIPIEVRYVNGSVEVACALGLADAVVDLIESGETMEAAGLEEISNIMNTETVFIANPKMANDKYTDILKFRFNGIKTAAMYSMIEYNVLKTSLAECKKITPGRKSPTLMPMLKDDWIAVKSLILKSDTPVIIENLRSAGATDILVYNLENCSI